MRNLLLAGLLLALSSAALAQKTQPAATPQHDQALLASNGPVVADYGKNEYSNDTPQGRIAREVRHELLMLPRYSLFDDLEYSVQGHTVTLSGFVTSEHAVTRNDAASAVKHIEGVNQVVNNIKELPPSPQDQETREEVFRALANSGALARYFWEAAPSIHIIVENQHVTLKGYVSSEGDKNQATIAASTVQGTLHVTNDLRVVK
jgi:osmotically-inducible protein OsmY